MNLTIAKEHILNGLQSVQNVVSTRTTLPILSNVLLRADGKRLEQYFCFGQTLVAPASGTVISTTADVPDNVPGTINTEQLSKMPPNQQGRTPTIGCTTCHRGLQRPGTALMP